MQHLLPLLHFCHCTDNYSLWQGRNHGWKVEGSHGLGPNTEAQASRGRAGCWVRKRVAPSRCEGPGVSLPEIFWKIQMLNPAFWWLGLLCLLMPPPPRTWNFLLFESYVQQVGGPIYIVRPQPKSWGDQSPPVPMVIAPMACGWHCFQVFCDCEHYSVPQK